MKTIEVFGETYHLRPTFDIADCVGGIDGFDVQDEDGNHLLHIDGVSEREVKSEIAWREYRVS